MTPILKLIFFVLIFLLTLLVGLRMFMRFNQRIKDSQTGRQLLANSLLLFGLCAALFVGAIYVLIYCYVYLAGGSK